MDKRKRFLDETNNRKKHLEKEFLEIYGKLFDEQTKDDERLTEMVKKYIDATIANDIQKDIDKRNIIISKQEVYNQYVKPVFDIIREEDEYNHIWGLGEGETHGGKELTYSPEEERTIDAEELPIWKIYYRIRKNFIDIRISFFTVMEDADIPRNRAIKIKITKDDFIFIHPQKELL